MLKIFLKVLSSIILSTTLITSSSYAQPVSSELKKFKIIKEYIYTNKGHKILVYNMYNTITGKSEKIINSHGWIFTNGQYWLNNEQVITILKDDYREIPYSQISHNDIIIVYKDKEPVNSFIACLPNNQTKQCENMKQPDMYLYVILQEKILLAPEILKVYRKIQKSKKKK